MFSTKAFKTRGDFAFPDVAQTASAMLGPRTIIDHQYRPSGITARYSFAMLLHVPSDHSFGASEAKDKRQQVESADARRVDGCPGHGCTSVDT